MKLIQTFLFSLYSLKLIFSEPVELLKSIPQDINPTSLGSFDVESLYAYLRTVHQTNPVFSDYGQFGKSYEKRSMQLLCLGRCGDDDTEHIAQTLFTGMHHSREPASMMTLVYFIDFILSSLSIQNIKQNPEVYYEIMNLLNNRQIWIIPLVNPDGYAKNLEIIKEEGSTNKAMQRKNRRKTCDKNDGLSGVDLNRNYDVCFKVDNKGSSDNPCTEDFRGEKPFSEPETELIKMFLLQHNITTAINYHSYGRDIVIPFSCKSLEDASEGKENEHTRVLNYLSDLGERLNAASTSDRFVVGYSYDKQMGLYPVNGDAADYMLNEFNIAAVSIELGELGKTGFWPDFSTDTLDLVSQVEKVSKEALGMTLESAWSSGPYLHVEEIKVKGKGSSFCTQLLVENKGMWDSFGELLVKFIGLGVDTDPLFDEERSSGKLVARSGSRKFDFCVPSETLLSMQQVLGSSKLKFQVIVSDAAHCVVNDFSFDSTEAQKDDLLFIDFVKRADPGFGPCSALKKIEDLYFDRPAKEDLVINYTLPKKKKVHKVWETDPPTFSPVKKHSSDETNIYKEERKKELERLKNFKFYSGVALAGVTGVVFSLVFVFFGLKFKDRIEEYKYDSVEEEDHEIGEYEEDSFMSDV
eukprot:snap_masked-scaffold_1-processed-gene-11.22-mRNA-1 protein AED:1.00 eAED:1.00 QI:0/-1/0/0/-1/1/1/0/636